MPIWREESRFQIVSVRFIRADRRNIQCVEAKIYDEYGGMY